MALMIFDKGIPSPAKLRDKNVSQIHSLNLSQQAKNRNHEKAHEQRAIYSKTSQTAATSNQTLNYLKHESRTDSLENRRRLSANHIMSSPVETITVHDLVTNAKQRMLERNISHLVVVNEKQIPLAMLNYNELMKIEAPEQVFIQHLVSEETLAVSADTLVREIALSFAKYKATAITVVDDNSQVIGVIARSDLLNLLVSGPNQQVRA